MRAAAVASTATLACVLVLSGASAQDTAPEVPAFKPPAILAQRRKASKEAGVDAAVESGLDWLRRHVATDGRWDCDGYDDRCSGAKCGGAGLSTFDPGVTALAVLAFLGAGRTQTEGDDAALLRGALQYLRDIQDSEGCFGPRTSSRFLYNHVAATTAVAEAWWLTGDKSLAGPAANGCDFLELARNPYLAWRYGVPADGDNDTSVAIWCTLAMRTGEFASLDVPRNATYVGVRNWIDKMTEPSLGRVGYQQRGGNDARAWTPKRAPEKPDPKPAPPAPKGSGPFKDIPVIPFVGVDVRSAGSLAEFGNGVPQDVLDRYPNTGWSSLSAGAALVTTLTGGAESAANVDRWVALVASQPPSVARGKFLDLHYLLYGSLFHAQRPFAEKPPKDADKKTWRSWRDVAVAELTAAQCAKSAGCAAGSWDPELDPFGFAGGRVYSTAMALLALEAPNRFPRVWDPKVKKLPPSGK